VLRPLRVLRSVRLIRAARLGQLTAGSGLVVHEGRMRLASRAALLALGTAAILVFAPAVMEFDVERSAAHANITSFPDALWWAASTITTVGYGDVYPVTAAGRAIAVVPMLAGVGILGVATVTAGRWRTARGRADRPEDVHGTPRADSGRARAPGLVTAAVTYGQGLGRWLCACSAARAAYSSSSSASLSSSACRCARINS
jgi:Ion channel